MFRFVNGLFTLIGRIFLAGIFLMSAAGDMIPNFSKVAASMEEKKVPYQQIMLLGAIIFLLVGSLSLIVGFRARIGAFLLLIFLVLANYYIHAFWKIPEATARAQEMMHFLKNVSLMGAMLIVMGNGPGSWSLDAQRLGAKKISK
jgi:putative oxidoreductase